MIIVGWKLDVAGHLEDPSFYNRSRAEFIEYVQNVLGLVSIVHVDGDVYVSVSKASAYRPSDIAQALSDASRIANRAEGNLIKLGDLQVFQLPVSDNLQERIEAKVRTDLRSQVLESLATYENFTTSRGITGTQAAFTALVDATVEDLFPEALKKVIGELAG